MRILVPTKRVPDTDLRISVSADGKSIDTDHVPFVVNPFDAIALEEAIRIREGGEDSGLQVEIVAVGIGSAEYEEQLRTALAMGADRAMHVECTAPLDPWNVSRLLCEVVRREKPDLVLMGKQAVDDDANQAGQFLAALLDWPQATFASRIELEADSLRVAREVDQGLETVSLALPAVVTADLRLNEPRYASLAGIRKARKQDLERIAVDELGVAIEPRQEILHYSSPQVSRSCQRFEKVDELIELIRGETGAES